MTALLIVGAGGHGKVVADAALAGGDWSEVAFLDDLYPQLDGVVGCPIIGRVEDAPAHLPHYAQTIVAIGGNAERIDCLDWFEALGFEVVSVLHPTATLSGSACVGRGGLLAAGSVVNPDSSLGRGCIINTVASIDHDCVVGEGVHVSPGAHLAGGVRVGARSWIGIGANVIQGIRIGEDSTVGAGAMVHRDVLPGVTVVGVPASVVQGVQ